MIPHDWQPLTHAQQAYWDEFMQHPDKPLSIVAHCLAITGPVDSNKLAVAIQRTLAEAQALSLKFRQIDGEPYPMQMVDRDNSPCVEVVDLSDQANALEQANANMRLDVETPIDLAQDAMTRVQLYLINPDKVLWYLRTHHIAVDGYSMYLIEQRCAHWYQCLRNEAEPQSGLKPFGVYLKENTDYVQSSRFEIDKVYWERYLDSANLTLSDGEGAITDTAVAARAIPTTVSHALVALAQKLMIGWGDVLTLLCAAYLYQDGRCENGVLTPLPVWLPFMNRMGNPCANTPALMVNTIPYWVTLNQNEPIDLFLKRSVTELRNHYRHGRYRVENKRASGGHYFLSPFINVLPFDPPEFQACSTHQTVIAGGVADGFNVTFRSSRQATNMSLKIEAETRLFKESALENHADKLLKYLSKTLQVV